VLYKYKSLSNENAKHKNDDDYSTSEDEENMIISPDEELQPVNFTDKAIVK